MKQTIALLLTLSLLLLGGCALGGETSEPEESSVPDITKFAPTTLYEDDLLAIEILSATKPTGAGGATDAGVDYAMTLQNKSEESIVVELSGITVNDKAIDASQTVTVKKNEALSVDFPLDGAKLAAADITLAEKVGLHVKVTSGERWWMPTLLERDLVFYPIARSTDTGTATATTAA